MGHTYTLIDGRCGAGVSDFIEALMIGSWELGVGELLSKSSLLTLGEWDVIE